MTVLKSVILLIVSLKYNPCIFLDKINYISGLAHSSFINHSVNALFFKSITAYVKTFTKKQFTINST